MSPPVRVALLGFTRFERKHIEPALATLRQGRPVYQLRVNDLSACNLVIADGDHEPAIVQVLHQKRLASAVMVGSARHPGAGAHLPRPIHLPSLLKVLDALVGRSPPMSDEVQRVQDMLATMLARPAPSGAVAPFIAPASTLISPGHAGHGPMHGQQRGTALLVDTRQDSYLYLARELAPLGLGVQRVAGGGEALERLQEEIYEFVFLATGDSGADESDGMDGFHTCRLLQRMPPAQPIAPPPTLVLLLAADTGVDRLRAERAGADAWLTPPWSTEALLKIADERDRWLRQSGKRAG